MKKNPAPKKVQKPAQRKRKPVRRIRSLDAVAREAQREQTGL